MNSAVFQSFFVIGTGQDALDAGADQILLHPEKGLKLSGKGAGVTIFGRCAGADGEEPGMGEMPVEVTENLFFAEIF